jgi:hypothetical protein
LPSVVVFFEAVAVDVVAVVGIDAAAFAVVAVVAADIVTAVVFFGFVKEAVGTFFLQSH